MPLRIRVYGTFPENRSYSGCCAAGDAENYIYHAGSASGTQSLPSSRKRDTYVGSSRIYPTGKVLKPTVSTASAVL